MLQITNGAEHRRRHQRARRCLLGLVRQSVLKRFYLFPEATIPAQNMIICKGGPIYHHFLFLTQCIFSRGSKVTRQHPRFALILKMVQKMSADFWDLSFFSAKGFLDKRLQMYQTKQTRHDNGCISFFKRASAIFARTTRKWVE